MEIKKGQMFKLLDKGEVEVVDWLGSDLTVVNAARVSFGKRKDRLDSKDEDLIKYLAENKHWSPFRHSHVQLRIKAPEFVFRQMFRHLVGIETTSQYYTKDMAFNEISGRYTEVSEYYVPSVWRGQSIDNKQASKGAVEHQDTVQRAFDVAMEEVYYQYQRLLQLGVAKEQARIILPLNIYTEVYWTASFQAIMNFIELRDHDHAQWEIREYAKVIKDIMLDKFPVSTSIWLQENKT